MAILNKIRQRSLVLIVVIAMALFAFVIGDLIRNSDALFSAPQDVVATINGVDIDRNDFNRKVSNITSGNPNMTNVQAMNNVYNQEKTRIVLESEFEALGITVGNDQMLDLLKDTFSTSPDFQNEDGVYDESKMISFINQLKDEPGQRFPLIYPNGARANINIEDWNNIEESLALNAKRTAYYDLIKSGVSATIPEAEMSYFGDNNKADISFVQLPYLSIADSLVTVSSSDIVDYMNKHEDKYKVDATRELMYVEFKEDPTEADEESIKQRLLDLKKDSTVEAERNGIIVTDSIIGFDNTTDYKTFVNFSAESDINYDDRFLRKSEITSLSDSITNLSEGEYYGPYKDAGYFKLSKMIEKKQMADSSKVRHILINHVGATRALPSVTRTSEEAQKEADSLFGILKDNPSKFKEFLKYSSDEASNLKDGELEVAYNTTGMAFPFKEFSINGEVGDMEVVQTQFGFHIIEVLDKYNYSETYQVATVAYKINPSEATVEAVYNQMANFYTDAKEQDFKTLADTLKLQARPITFKELDENIPGLGSQRDIVRWAFDDNNSVGDVEKFTISGKGYVVAKLVKQNEEGQMDIQAASVSARPAILKEKKAEMIKEKIKSNVITEIAANQGQTVRTAKGVTFSNSNLSGAGNEPKVVGAVFGLKEGETSEPIAGETGVYVVKVDLVKTDKGLDNYASNMNRLTTQIRTAVQNRVQQALEKDADIEDNRAKTVY